MTANFEQLKEEKFATAPIDTCVGVSTTVTKYFHKLSIFTVLDLLTHFPRHYENRSQITPIHGLQAGTKSLCQGQVIDVRVMGQRRKMLLVSIAQGSAVLLLRFFHFSVARVKQFQHATTLRCFGEVKLGKQSIEMIHPEIKFLTDKTSSLPDYLIAVYPSIEGLPQFRIHNAINPLLNSLRTEKPLVDYIQTPLQQIKDIDDLANLSINQAIYLVHRPPLDTSTEALENNQTPFFKRLSLEELSSHRLGLKRVQQSFQTRKAPRIESQKSELSKRFLEALPFSPTEAQRRCSQEIIRGMQHNTPMMRLLQGDVGSGKTLVVTLAMLDVVEQGWKAALMVPTELLAQQHFNNLYQWLSPLGVSVQLICGKQTVKQRRQIGQALVSEEPLIIVGTHALFQKAIEIHKLALIIIDEQHRFGVEQRFDLLNKSVHQNFVAHQILISATPIPRTLAMTIYGDLQQSILDQMPAGRQHIETRVMNNQQVSELSQKIGEQCQKGKQVYWVCPFIDESETLNVQSAIQRYEQLEQTLSDVTVGLIHGKLKENEKSQVMNDFRNGKTQLLVATTVIEVGVDVPNASIIIIENAERMGLAQLHQLRGRVGRGDVKSLCILLYQAPLSQQGYARLSVLRQSNDGFFLAEKDLQMRGAGEVIGIRQSGSVQFKIADMLRDKDLIPKVVELSDKIEKLTNVDPASVIEKSLLQRWDFSRSELGKV